MFLGINSIKWGVFDMMTIICHDEVTMSVSLINAIIFGVTTLLYFVLQATHILPDSVINGPIGFLLQFILYVGLFFFIALTWRNYKHKKNLERLEQEKAILLMEAQQQQKQATQQPPQSLQ
jgi:hypothetical protein